MSAAATKAGKTRRARRRPERHKAGKKSGRPGRAAPRTLAEFMAQALAMEREAAQRYAEFADAMDVHNNPEVAALFRKMATIERKHAAQIMA